VNRDWYETYEMFQILAMYVFVCPLLVLLAFHCEPEGDDHFRLYLFEAKSSKSVAYLQHSTETRDVS